MAAAADALRNLPVNALVALFQTMMPAPAPAPAPAPFANQALPNNAIKLPTFRGESADDKDPLPEPADVVSFIKRVDAFSHAYQHTYTTEDLKLDALLSCFPPGSPAAKWYDSADGRSSFASYADFSTAFWSVYGPTDADKLRYEERFQNFRQLDTSTVRTYYSRFLHMLSNMEACGVPVQLHQARSKFVNGLRPVLKREVYRQRGRQPNMPLEDLLHEAVNEERVHKPLPKPSLRGMNGQPQKKCFFCKEKGHDGKDCPKIACLICHSGSDFVSTGSTCSTSRHKQESRAKNPMLSGKLNFGLVH
jgi:hypothetical protein